MTKTTKYLIVLILISLVGLAITTTRKAQKPEDVHVFYVCAQTVEDSKKIKIYWDGVHGKRTVLVCNTKGYEYPPYIFTEHYLSTEELHSLEIKNYNARTEDILTIIIKFYGEDYPVYPKFKIAINNDPVPFFVYFKSHNNTTTLADILSIEKPVPDDR
ncbi:hypothetical protein DRJ17_06020 [Candidatus Woesearchaeota archaeon]|nr:MAG: hypothetical protein DRJ17_06020 [Candidatus Woesearchaeota archaeon]